MSGLYYYARGLLSEYRNRGGKGFADYDDYFDDEPDNTDDMIELPWWLGNKYYHAGQRGHLYRKDPVFYAKFKHDENSPLLYPVNDLQSFVERVGDGAFRKFPLGTHIHKSVIEAARQ